MNRVIKFRGKRVDNGQWVFGNCMIRTMYPQGEPIPCIQTVVLNDDVTVYKANLAEVHPSTVGQFWTTWDDIELYDGDVLEAEYVVTQELFAKVTTEKITVRLELQWRKDWGGFVFHDRENKTMEHADILALRNVTKHLGNIHDNPELI